MAVAEYSKSTLKAQLRVHFWLVSDLGQIAVCVVL